jgi:hypothetical protein
MRMGREIINLVFLRMNGKQMKVKMEKIDLHKRNGCTGGSQASEPDESRTLIRNFHIGLETNVSLNTIEKIKSSC